MHNLSTHHFKKEKCLENDSSRTYNWMSCAVLDISPLLLPLFGRRPFGYQFWLRLQVLLAIIQSSSAAAVLCLFVFVLLLLIRLIIYQPIYQSLSHSIYAFLSCVSF